jgi:RHS repeat-associated protein
VNGTEVSNRRFVWCDNEICEEQTPAGIVTKRFFNEGMKVETGLEVGRYFYARDHLGSVREVIDDAGSVRARFDYDPYGAQSRISGDLQSEFGFTGHFYHEASSLCLAKYRAYDPKLARWLSRDPFPSAQTLQEPNLYYYAENNPVSSVDPDGRTPYRLPSPPAEDCYKLADEARFECMKKGGTSDDCMKNWLTAYEECEARNKSRQLFYWIEVCGVLILIIIVLPVPKFVPA